MPTEPAERGGGVVTVGEACGPGWEPISVPKLPKDQHAKKARANFCTWCTAPQAGPRCPTPKETCPGMQGRAGGSRTAPEAPCRPQNNLLYQKIGDLSHFKKTAKSVVSHVGEACEVKWRSWGIMLGENKVEQPASQKMLLRKPPNVPK